MLALGKMPSMGTFSARLATFDENWPNNTRADPEDFACAGLYYIKRGDSVKCFFCGGGLRNWELYDDPYLQHAKWYPSCQFIIHKKGLAYVRKVGIPKTNVVYNNCIFNNCSIGGTLIRSTIHHNTVSEAKVKSIASCSTTVRFQNAAIMNSSTKEVIHQTKDAEMIKDLKTCKICFENDSNILFLPCAHLCSCSKCSENLTKCPICRRNIDEKVRTYMC